MARTHTPSIDNVDNVRFLIKGGSDTTEFELLAFDQSGLTSPGTDVCHVIDVISASVVKFINCQFKGGVTHTGAYIHMGDTSGQSADLIWIDGCELRDAGAAADLDRRRHQQDMDPRLDHHAIRRG
jgi:hypothetical protein